MGQVTTVDGVCAADQSPAVTGWEWLALVLLLAAAVAVRLARLEIPSFDELWHLALTKGWGSPLGAFKVDVIYHDQVSQTSLEGAHSIASVWAGMRGVLHPPLYVVLLRLWREIAGDSDVAAQCLSIACSLVGIVFCYATARLAMNRAIASIAAATLAFSQTQVYFAQEIRGYAMLAALGSIGLWLMTRVELLGPSRRRATALAVVSFLIVLTHYFGVGAVAAIAVYGFLRMGSHRRWFISMMSFAAVAYAVVWLPAAISQLHLLGTGDALLYRPDVSILERFALLAGVPFRLLAERDYQVERTPLISGVLFLVPWLLVKRFRPLMPWALWLCLSVLPVFLLDLSRSTVHLALIRYVAVATPAVPLLFAGVAWRLNRRLAYLCAAASMAVGAIYLVSRNVMPIDSPDLSPVARTIAAHIAPGEPIVSYEPPAREWMSDVWMMTCSHEPGLFPRTVAEMTRPMELGQVQDLRCKSLWLICRSLDRPLGEIIPRATLIKTYGGVPGVAILHIELSPAAAASEPAVESTR